MASFFNFSHPVEVDVRLAGEDDRQSVEVKADHGAKPSKADALAGRERCPVYLDGESVRGQVRCALVLEARATRARLVVPTKWGRGHPRRADPPRMRVSCRLS